MTITRRTFLGRTAVVIGAAGAASLRGPAVLGATVAPGLAAAEASVSDLGALDTPVMLAVTDAGKGQFEILVGETSVPFTDRALARRLLHATKAVNDHVVAP